MRILYFGSYDPNYTRNRGIINGLKKSGIEVIECRIKPGNWLSLFKLIPKHFKVRNDYDLMIVGFPGQEVMFLARFLTSKPIIFDAFTSHYGGYILDRNYYSKNSFRAKYYRFLDKWSCKLADSVLLDTNAHIDFFTREFKLPRQKFKRVLVGTDSTIFYPKKIEKETDKFSVNFYGHFIPLHGVDVIIRAAKMLENENIVFNIIGQGQTYEQNRKLANDLKIKNINFIGNVPYEKLSDYINKSDIFLGIFGTTEKANLVIPNKVYDAAACGKAIITGDTQAIKEVFKNMGNILLSKIGDPEDLANKIVFLKNNPNIIQKLGENALNVFKENCTESLIGEDLMKYINEKYPLSR